MTIRIEEGAGAAAAAGKRKWTSNKRYGAFAFADFVANAREIDDSQSS